MEISRRGFLGTAAIIAAVMLADPAFAWDVEHDEIAQLTCEYLPREVKDFFRFEDFGTILANCHFPDWLEWEPRFHSYDELVQGIGPEYAGLLKAEGFKESGWLHHDRGREVTMKLLARAFREGKRHEAAFLIGCLSHSVSDKSSFNHTKIFFAAAHGKEKPARMPERKVEPGAKNLYGFRSDGIVMHKVRARLAAYVPKCGAETVADFDAAVAKFVADGARQGEVSQRLEETVAFGERKNAEEALAEVVAMQVQALEDIILTCWRRK